MLGGVDMPRGAPGGEGPSLQGAVLWAESVHGLLMSQVEALVLLCAEASPLLVKDTLGLGEHLMQRDWGGVTVVSPSVPQPDQEHPHLRVHHVLPWHPLPPARLRAPVPPDDPALPGERLQEVWHVHL